jgi:hypothetical protein
MDESENRNPMGQWKKGVSGNAAGRPRGSRNKKAALVEALLDDEAADLARIVLDRAREGDPTAMRLCFERIAPAPRGRAVELDLPEDAATISEEALGAMRATVRALGSGELTPTEAATIAQVIDIQRRVHDAVEIEQRLDALERHLDEREEAEKRAAGGQRLLASNWTVK